MINTSEVIGSLSTRRLIEALQKALPSLRIIEGNMFDDKKPLRNELFVRQIDTSVSEATGTDEVQQLKLLGIKIHVFVHVAESFLAPSSLREFSDESVLCLVSATILVVGN